MNKPQKNSLINKILIYLKDTSKDLLDVSVMIMFNPRKLIRGMGIYKDYNYPIYNLKKSPYFVFRDNNFYLSFKGRVEIIKNIIKDKKKVKKWDGKWRAVIFDVPEPNRHERNFLRRELKWMGFRELQHSIWITPHDIEKELVCLLELWHNDFSGDIRILKIEKIINDKDFRKIFKI
ncbi:MAG: hypothetical protein A3C58_02245 [Candidatus Staskawiczbacteria bacterium RIFCSPHIGHO2_02_FULL_34_10]|uniref:Transcriptional repressor PaaX-like central Cas2-like domain-containing protein n=1 Tax=Candidatus Staskawiczbacteria bacterium RIFCSPHIGHO2_02_FULL_34_10 TaxID=1802205 RepID=A0A1G2HYL0_9BACT|nr:MAG: hypothetical protein A3C58_02245 [Candidatus Staskawiczbacteria bacterium RIFCSPHIGHO2_02_FULL_34_10]